MGQKGFYIYFLYPQRSKEPQPNAQWLYGVREYFTLFTDLKEYLSKLKEAKPNSRLLLLLGLRRTF